MASVVSNTNVSYSTDPNTTFVQADPSNFRTIVQTLTGVSSTDLPLNPYNKPSLSLHHRRLSSGKLHLNLNFTSNDRGDDTHNHQPPAPAAGQLFLASPVSHLDYFWGRVSPRSPTEEEEEMEVDEEEEEEEEEEEIIMRRIAEKGFYLHPSPMGTPSGAEPELLPLFPLHSAP